MIWPIKWLSDLTNYSTSIIGLRVESIIQGTGIPCDHILRRFGPVYVEVVTVDLLKICKLKENTITNLSWGHNKTKLSIMFYNVGFTVRVSWTANWQPYSES